MECSPLHGTVFKGTDPYLQYSRNIHIVYIIFIHLVYNGSSLLYLIVYICHLWCLIETTDSCLSFHGSNTDYISQFTDSNVDISPFTRDNYIHGHHSSTTSCLNWVCVWGNKSIIIGTLASVLVLTGQTCGDCHLIIELAIQSFLGFIQLNIPLFYSRKCPCFYLQDILAWPSIHATGLCNAFTLCIHGSTARGCVAMELFICRLYNWCN